MPGSALPLALNRAVLPHLWFVLPLPDSLPQRRSNSCPADHRIRSREENQEEDEFPAVGTGEGRPATVGGEHSPAGWTIYFDNWKAAIAAGFNSTQGPELRFDRIAYDGGGFTGYFMIYWHPAPGSIFRDLDKVHSTLIRFRPLRWGRYEEGDVEAGGEGGGGGAENAISWEELSTVYYNEFYEGISGLFNSLMMLEHDGRRYHIPLARPPASFEQGSFAFGLGSALDTTLLALKQVLYDWLTRRFQNKIRVLYDRPVHISWD